MLFDIFIRLNCNQKKYLAYMYYVLLIQNSKKNIFV